MPVFFEMCGWAGMLLIVSAYAMVSFKKIKPTALSYPLMNLFGALGVGINVFYKQAWPAVALQVVWGAIGIYAIIKR